MADWSHIVTTPEHADANPGLARLGIRGVFLYGPPVAAGLVEWFVESTIPHPEDARRVRSEHFASGCNGRLTMGLALRGPELSTRETTKHDFDLARELDLPISIHCGLAGYAGRYRTVETLRELDLLGPDVNYAHANLLTDDDFRLIASSGGSISPCPSVDMLMALGTYPATGRALEHGVTTGLSVDTIAGAGTDLFTEMRVALAAERSRANAEAVAPGRGRPGGALDQRDMLRISTLDAAKAWHLDGITGSLDRRQARRRDRRRRAAAPPAAAQRRRHHRRHERRARPTSRPSSSTARSSSPAARSSASTPSARAS